MRHDCPRARDQKKKSHRWASPVLENQKIFCDVTTFTIFSLETSVLITQPRDI